MNKLGFSSLFDHMLTQNMHHMVGIVLTKKVFARYENFYKDNHGQNIHHKIIENNNLQKQINNLQCSMENKNKKIEDKNKEIIEIKIYKQS